MTENGSRKIRIQQALIIVYVLWTMTFGGCVPDFFPEKAKDPANPVDASWHAYKQIYAFDKKGVPHSMAKAFELDGLHTVLAGTSVPTDEIDRIDKDLQQFARKYGVVYHREGATASLVFSTKPMTGRPKIPGAKDIVRGTNPKLYGQFIDLAIILNREPDLLILTHGHGSDWFPNDHGLALELGLVEAESIRNLLSRVGIKNLDRVDSFGCDQEPGGTVVVTLVSIKVTEPYKVPGQRL